MTKKDYELIARVLEVVHQTLKEDIEEYPKKSRENALSTGGIITTEMIVTALSTAFKHDNPRFDSEKFLKACGLNEEVSHA